MQPTSLERAGVLKGSLVGAAFAVLWIVLAVARPETTFHLAPLIVAGTLPYAYATITKQTPARSLVVALSAGGTAAALVVTGILGVADKLRGPSLLPAGGAVAESVVFAFVGGAIGLLAVWSRRAT